MSDSHEHVLRSLRALRQRMRWQAFVRIVSRAALIGAAALLCVALVNRWWLARAPWDWRFASAIAAVVVFGSLLAAWTRRLTLHQTAQHIDRLGQTRDRFLTALVLSEKEAASPLATLAARECGAFIRGRDFRELIRVRVSSGGAWALAPLVAVALLQWDAREADALRRARAAEGRAEIADTASRLEQLAREAEKKAAESDDAQLKKLAEKLKQSAEQLRADATSKEEAEKAALQRLSELEQLVKEMQKAPPSASQEELRQLAKALENEEATKEAAAALQAGKMGDAAKALEEAAKKDELSAEQAEKALKQALDRIAQQRQLSEAMQQLSQQMQKQGGGGKNGDALQKLAQMLRQMQKPGQQGKQGQQQGGQGRAPTEQELQNLLSALQNMKSGEPQEGEGESQQQGGQGEGGKVAIQSFGETSKDGQPQNGSAQMPTGQPGGERDTGTTATPFGEKNDGQGEKGADLALKGRLAEGETLSALMPAAGDASKSNRRYKELYEAMAPAAQEAVRQEEIPLGSRFFIKRYFESIRPKQ